MKSIYYIKLHTQQNPDPTDPKAPATNLEQLRIRFRLPGHIQN